MTSNEPSVPDGMTAEDEAQIKLLTTIMASAILIKAKSDGNGITAAAQAVGELWHGKSIVGGKGTEYADAVLEFAVRIGESMNRVGGPRLRSLGIPA